MLQFLIFFGHSILTSLICFIIIEIKTVKPLKKQRDNYFKSGNELLKIIGLLLKNTNANEVIKRDLFLKEAIGKYIDKSNDYLKEYLNKE